MVPEARPLGSQDAGPPIPRGTSRFLLLSLACIGLFFLDLLLGSVRIPLIEVPRIFLGTASDPVWSTIMTLFRLPKAVTAVATGAALAVAGLILQTLFRNPLAGPDSLGIGAGASIGAGIVVILAGGAGSTFLGELGFAGYSALALASSLGAAVVLAVILAISRRVASSVTLLIIGILVGYFAGSILSVLIFFASPQKVQVFLGWTYGSFAGVTASRLPILLGAAFLGILIVATMTKDLDALLLGDRAAASIGINTRRARTRVLIAASLLAGTVTAFCGPIAFLGIAAPQGARRLFRTSAHRRLVPGSALVGIFFALLADVMSQGAPGGVALPINPLLALLGAPVILSIVLRSRGREAGS